MASCCGWPPESKDRSIRVWDVETGKEVYRLEGHTDCVWRIALSADEKRLFTAEFFRRAIPFDSRPLEDEETAHAADALFALLEAEENDAGSR